ncbi:MAG: hypothetical protein HQK78_16810 [Desulfobacterales bacterium]|nr:hypothetical protein [Desulfobacterales bacterium]
MSITDFFNKIKRFRDIDNFTYLYLIIIVFIGISAFGLGRLSVGKEDSKENFKNNEMNIKPEVVLINQENQINNVLNEEEKRFLASKNGKLYYTMGCLGAKRIAEKNIIWFGTSQDAELAGYELSSSCRK